ncbi:MAG: dipeptidase PepE [Bacteroidetes bacterium]|nr:dipeptidase PepE [Bacteroidota bacterium]MBU1578409.1 dipeptidase PepE [Bacteroidota bacterium]MBU2466400.1 dipeptidase PepE [Bacteroidota bacterium]MBU2556679.1 dipeptidase PepE [Bacteroidota bacterium]
MKLLLISNSTNAGESYLGWPKTFISEFMHKHKVSSVLFVPYAGVNLSKDGLKASYDAYETRVKAVFEALGFSLKSIHHEKDPVDAVNKAECIAVGGGNTFHLVAQMQKTGIMEAIRSKALNGMPYMGWSAGSNVACPTLKTTNDMPIFEPESFNCLNLIPFQINPHYLDANPEGHGGETRQQRIEEFLAINPEITVAGLREASLLELDGQKLLLKGSRNMRLFKAAKEPQEIESGADVSFLLG